MPRKKMTADLFIDGRVAINPIPLPSGKEATIKYKGLLAASGADAIYLHHGYDMNWSSVTETPMSREPDGNWSALIPIEGKNRLNFCFKDSANNWDNNNMMNWECPIS